MRYFLAIWTLLLVACSSVPALPPATLNDLADTRKLDVPFVAQQAYYCGPAALSAVANYRDIHIDQQSVADMSFVPERKGSLTVDMQAAGRRIGLLPYPLAPKFEDLLRELNAGNPILVLQNLGLSWWPQWHYAVAVGYDLRSSTLLLHSGEKAYYQLGFATFAATWARAKHWARVLVPASVMPVTAMPVSYLKSAHAFEETGDIERAMDFYQRAVNEWPGSVLAWLALANAAYAQGDFTGAINSYERALAVAPERASVWNNYAYALHANGCSQLAIDALGRALALAPQDENISNSRDDLLQRPGGRAPSGSCPERLPQ